jgi:hypothetical protein
MNTNIKNIDTLGLSQDDIAHLEAGAAQHLRFSRITFKVLGREGDTWAIRTTQDKSPANNYAALKHLVTITKELFEPTIGPVHVKAIAYNEPAPNVVSPEWLQAKMTATNCKVKDLVADTGIDKANISAWVNGVRPMSQPVKAMFYYYFLHR